MGAPGRGCLIALEGGEASGKTTQAHLLGTALGAVVTREPGGTQIGERIRALVLGDTLRQAQEAEQPAPPDGPPVNPDPPVPHVPGGSFTPPESPRPAALVPRAEALLMLAARAQHVAEVVEPALAGGHWVVTDRFAGSTLAYQGYGRHLDLVELHRLSCWASEDLWPDLSVLLEVPAELAASRRPAGRDRFEDEDRDFHQRVAGGYRTLAAAEPGRWAVVDGSGPPGAVAARVLEAVRGKLDTEQCAGPEGRNDDNTT